MKLLLLHNVKDPQLLVMRSKIHRIHNPQNQRSTGTRDQRSTGSKIQSFVQNSRSRRPSDKNSWQDQDPQGLSTKRRYTSRIQDPQDQCIFDLADPGSVAYFYLDTCLFLSMPYDHRFGKLCIFDHLHLHRVLVRRFAVRGQVRVLLRRHCANVLGFPPISNLWQTWNCVLPVSVIWLIDDWKWC